MMITGFEPATQVTKTMYGKITNKEWMHREKFRLESAGRKCKVISKGGFVALECWKEMGV